MYYEITQGIEVEVAPEYLPDQSSPDQAQFIFAYHVTITNRGETEVQLMTRHRADRPPALPPLACRCA